MSIKEYNPKTGKETKETWYQDDGKKFHPSLNTTPKLAKKPNILNGRARGSDINGLTNRNSQDKAVNRMLGSTKEMR